MSENNSDKSCLCNFGYADYIVLASTLAIALAEDLSSDDLNILGNFFTVFADELFLITSVQSICTPSKPPENDINSIPPIDMDRCNKKKPIKKNIRRKVKKK